MSKLLSAETCVFGQVPPLLRPGIAIDALIMVNTKEYIEAFRSASTEKIFTIFESYFSSRAYGLLAARYLITISWFWRRRPIVGPSGFCRVCGGGLSLSTSIYVIFTSVHMKTLKYNAIVGSIGVVCKEIAFPGSESLTGMSAIVPASSLNVSHDMIGRFQADSQGVATGRHSSLMLCSFTKRVLAQLDLWSRSKRLQCLSITDLCRGCNFDIFSILD